MTPDEHICTTCEGRDAVNWYRPLGCQTEIEPHDERRLGAVLPAHAWRGGMHVGVDTCPECGRGGEVGKL